MKRRDHAPRWMAQLAALARIEELATRRTDMDEHTKARVRAVWALGDYGRFARETVWSVGPELVRACGIRSGMRVLDVAAGTGNVAIRAAEAGAQVVACDLTPENFAAGRQLARERGVELEWVVGDAEQLPIAAGEFDAVTSSFGAMFAPDHRRVAAELVRVCRPGGIIAMANFTPGGLAGAFFDVLAPYLPPPPADASSPLAWGDPHHVRALLGSQVAALDMTVRTYVESARTPEAYCALYHETFGPVVAVRSALAEQPGTLAAFDRALLEFATRANRGAPGGPTEYPYEYLLIVARR